MDRRLSAALGVVGLLCSARAATAQLPVGTPAPQFTLRDTQGRPVSLSQFRGRRYVLLNFWSSWCEFCKRDMPRLQALQDQYPRQMVVLGVNADEESPGAGAAAARRLKVSYSVLLEGDQVMAQYAAVGFPTNYLIDPGGQIVEGQVGADTGLWARVEAIVSRYQPPGEERHGTGGPRKAAQITHELTFPLPPGPREWVVGREVVIRFNRPEGIEADLVSLSVDGKQVAVFGPAGSYPWDAGTVSNGPHTLRLAAQTASGRETWATELVVIVDNRPPVEETIRAAKPAASSSINGATTEGAPSRPRKAPKPRPARKRR